MPRQEEINQQEELLQAHRATLSAYLIRFAALGGKSYAPPEVINGIDEARAGIARCKVALRGWGESVDDHPDDEAERSPPPMKLLIAGSPLGLLVVVVLALVFSRLPQMSSPVIPTASPGPTQAVIKVRVHALADCEATEDLSGRLTKAMTGTLAFARVMIEQDGPVVRDADAARNSPLGPSDIIVWGNCSGEQVTYHLEFPLVAPGQEHLIAELDALSITFPLTVVLTPETTMAAAIMYHAGDSETAAATFTKASAGWAQLAPAERANLEFMFGNAWLQHREPRTDQALKQYAAAQHDSPSEEAAAVPLAAMILNNLGYAHLTKSEYYKAITVLSQAIDKNSSYTWARLNRSEAYIGIDQFEDALKDCDEAITSRGSYAPGYVCRAQVYYRTRDWLKMQRAAEIAIDTDPQYGPAYYYAGISSYQLHNASAAVLYLSQVRGRTRERGLIDLAEGWLRLIGPQVGVTPSP